MYYAIAYQDGVWHPLDWATCGDELLFFLKKQERDEWVAEGGCASITYAQACKIFPNLRGNSKLLKQSLLRHEGFLTVRSVPKTEWWDRMRDWNVAGGQYGYKG